MSKYTAAGDPDDDADDTERLRLDDPADERAPAGENVTADEGSGDGFWDLGVVTTLVVVGLGLVVFPEPATSIAGVLLLTVGVCLGVLELVT